MRTVKFLENYSPYIKGDLAGFPDEVTDEFLEKGLVEEMKSETEENTNGQNS